MDEKDRKLILAIANRLGAIEEDIRFLKGSKPPAPIASAKPLNGSRAANKFFGAVVTESKEPECTTDLTFKEEVTDKEILSETDNGTKMLRKAVEEFCQEFDIKEFNITYIDPTPKKDI